MKTIYKYTLGESTFLEIPKGAKFLHSEEQPNAEGVIQAWFLVDTDADIEHRVFESFGTGHEIKSENELEYLTTTLLFKGNIVIHTFEAFWEKYL